MGPSFHEKSLWLMFISLVACFGFYFATALPTATADVMPHQVALFVLAIVVLVVMQIVGHILIVIVDRRTATDERDRLAELKGSRNAGFVLATGVFFALCIALVIPGNFIFTHVLLAFWVLAQLVEIGSQIFLLRRGA